MLRRYAVSGFAIFGIALLASAAACGRAVDDSCTGLQLSSCGDDGDAGGVVDSAPDAPPADAGSCDEVCPGPASGNGSATCSPAGCGISCNGGYHACDGKCLPDDADPSVDPCMASDAFGVFVVAGATGTGTQAAPLGSLTSAMQLAASSGNNRVFVCAVGKLASAANAASNAGGVSVYGGFTACPPTGRWTYTPGTRSVVAPSAPGPALTVSGSNLHFYDMELDAQDGKNPGESSIASFVTGANNVSFTRCALKAGIGQAGVDGAAIADYTDRSTDGVAGSATTGGGKVTVVCGNGSGTTVGGAGGQPGGNNGAAPGGLPAISPVNPDKATGAPGDASKADCGNGSSGAKGSYGTGGGSGLGATSLGVLSAQGWTPSAGTTGGIGGVGQGGGGGASLDLSGGGGGGSAGGCGGSGGAPGGGGGASIALLIFDSTGVTISSSTLSAASAGRGGNGGTGQKGQPNGNPGAGFTTAECSGGPGGAGGSGGGAGGGAGGISAAIAWAGTAAPVTSSITTSVSPTVAPGGQKGSGGPAARTTAPASNPGQDGTAGVNGVSQAVLKLQ